MSARERHSRLQRLIRKHLGSDEVPDDLAPLLDSIDSAFKDLEADRLMLERSMDLSSRELIQANSEMRAVFQVFPDVFFRVDANGVILDARGGTEEDLPLRPHELRGRLLQDIAGERVRTEFVKAMERARESRSMVSFEYRTEERRHRRDYEARLLPLGDGTSIAVIRNITERRRTERLRAGRGRILRAIAEASPTEIVLGLVVEMVEEQDGRVCAVLLQDPRDETLYVGRSAASLPSGYSQEVAKLRIGAAEGSHDAACYQRERVIVEDVDDHPSWPPFRQMAADMGFAACWCEPIISSGDTVLGSVVIYSEERTGPGQAELELMWSAAQLAGIALEKERAEKQSLELNQQLARAERIESVGVLAGGVAHDLNNMLGPVVAYPDLLLKELPPDSELGYYAAQIREGALRAAAVIQDLLTLARRGSSQFESVDPAAVITDYLASPGFRELSGTLRNIEVVVECPADLPTITGTSRHLSQAVMNLVLNAFEAMAVTGGRLTVGARAQYVELPIGTYDSVAIGDYVVISISDTGPGISEDDLEHIFEPFYTKRAMGTQGSGLGLAVVYGVVKDFNGYIDVQTKPGEGTTFLLYFPVAEALRDQTDEADAGDYRGSETILVVDDERGQRELARRMLSGVGYEVVTASSGREAIRHLESNQVDLVVLDMIMEDGFDGLDTYRAILRLHPGQPCIITSGFSETNRARAAQQLGAGAYVRKPYTLGQIGAAVRRELDKVPNESVAE